MSFIDKPINWTGSEISATVVVETKSISKEDAKKKVNSLQKKLSSFLSEAQELYSGAPTSELSSIVLMAENIERELEKLK
jgi:histidine ammonia-lyase